MLFESRLLARTVPVRRLGATMEAAGGCSGCLVDFRGKRILLTVAHATRRSGDWGIEVGYIPGMGTQIYRVGPMNFIAECRLSGSRRRTVDLAFVEVPRNVPPLVQDIDPMSGLVVRERRRIVIRSTLDHTPRTGASYGFAGYVELKGNRFELTGRLKVETGLTFERSLTTKDRFRLPHAHTGHDEYHGVSGAPVLDRSNRLVGLVVGGHRASGAIYAVPLAKYRREIAIALGLTP